MEKGFAKKRLVDVFVFGIMLWLMGFIGSLILFPFVSMDILGWILCIIFTPITILITYYRFRNRKMKFFCYFMTGVFWMLIAVLFDYLFIVKLFNASDYYKLDVFVYYAFTLAIPVVIGLINRKKK